jgi:3-methyladenine DNA glycosylase/8-oxoguanine DNA glycosylase
MKELTETQSFEVEVVPPYDLNLSIEKEMGIRKMDNTDIVVDIFYRGVFWTGMTVNGNDLGLKLTQENNTLVAEVFSSGELTNEDEDKILRTIEYRFGPHEDILPFYELAEKDEILNHICSSHYGMRKVSCSSLFDMVSIAILLQNAPVKRTNQMIANLLHKFGRHISFDNKSLYLWFTPGALDSASTESLTNECRLGYRAPYLKSIASALAHGYDLESVRLLPTREAKEKLMELKGIGPYSAEMILLDMRRYDVFPVDSWSVQIYWDIYFSDPMPQRREALDKAREHAETLWGQWRGLAWTYIVYSVELGGINV